MPVTRQQFDQDLERLRHGLVTMATSVDSMLDEAIQVVMQQDESLAKKVIRADHHVDELDVEIETVALRLITLQQPVASDLRLISTATSIHADLERIGDYAVDIAKIGRRIARRGTLYKSLIDLPRLAGLARKILADAVAAFIDGDREMVERVLADDDAIDDLYHQQRDYLTDLMEQSQSDIYLSVNLLFVAKYLERVGDHAVNIAARVHYMQTGQLMLPGGKHRKIEM